MINIDYLERSKRVVSALQKFLECGLALATDMGLDWLKGPDGARQWARLHYANKSLAEAYSCLEERYVRSYSFSLS